MDNEGNLLVSTVEFLMVAVIIRVLIWLVVKLGRFKITTAKQYGLTIVLALIISVFIKFI